MSEEIIENDDNVRQETEVQVIADKLQKMFNEYIRLAILCFFFFVFGVLVILILLLVNIFRLKKLHSRLKKLNALRVFGEYGKPLVWGMVLTLTVFLTFVDPIPFYILHGTYEVREKVSLSIVYDMLQKYAKENNGEYPVSGWDKEILGSDKLKSTTGVTLNPEALKLGVDMPDDMVLGFIDDSGSIGQQGVFEEHDAGYFKDYGFLFGDGTIKHVNRMQFKYLRWSENEVAKPKVNQAGIIIVLSLVSATIVYIYNKSRKVRLKVNSIFASYSIVAGFLGLLLGMYALFYHNRSFVTERDYMFSIYGAGLLSVVLASGYVRLMTMMKQSCEYGCFSGWATVYGSLAGILCSSVLHIILSFICFDLPIIPVIAALPFGAWAGMVVGWMVGKKLDERSESLESASTK